MPRLGQRVYYLSKPSLLHSNHVARHENEGKQLLFVAVAYGERSLNILIAGKVCFSEEKKTLPVR